MAFTRLEHFFSHDKSPMPSSTSSKKRVQLRQRCSYMTMHNRRSVDELCGEWLDKLSMTELQCGSEIDLDSEIELHIHKPLHFNPSSSSHISSKPLQNSYSTPKPPRAVEDVFYHSPPPASKTNSTMIFSSSTSFTELEILADEITGPIKKLGLEIDTRRVDRVPPPRSRSATTSCSVDDVPRVSSTYPSSRFQSSLIAQGGHDAGSTPYESYEEEDKENVPPLALAPFPEENPVIGKAAQQFFPDNSRSTSTFLGENDFLPRHHHTNEHRQSSESSSSSSPYSSTFLDFSAGPDLSFDPKYHGRDHDQPSNDHFGASSICGFGSEVSTAPTTPEQSWNGSLISLGRCDQWVKSEEDVEADRNAIQSPDVENGDADFVILKEKDAVKAGKGKEARRKGRRVKGILKGIFEF